MRRFKVYPTRQSRRVFAQKTLPSTTTLRREFILRGGGYL